MNPRDARVPDAPDAVAHRFGGQRGFFGDGDVARARRDDGDFARAAFGQVATDANHARRRVPLGIGHDVAHLAEGRLVRPRDEHVGRARDQPLDDLDDLHARLARAEHDFGKPQPRRPRIINTRVADVFKMKITDASRRFALVQLAALAGAQQSFYLSQVHRINSS